MQLSNSSDGKLTRRDAMKFAGTAAAIGVSAGALSGCASTQVADDQQQRPATPAAHRDESPEIDLRSRRGVSARSIPSTFARAAFPLGGIGTGTVSLGARGDQITSNVSASASGQLRARQL